MDKTSKALAATSMGVLAIGMVASSAVFAAAAEQANRFTKLDTDWAAAAPAPAPVPVKPAKPGKATATPQCEADGTTPKKPTASPAAGSRIVPSVACHAINTKGTGGN